jgi:Family of unknown function (DUF5343)
MVTDTESKPGTPPYISFKTLTNLFERLQQTHLPPRIDRSYLDGMSGGYQTQVVAALRWLDLIGDNGETRPVLVALATKPESRPQVVAELLRSRYSSVFALSDANATQGQLEEAFRDFGVSGSTLRKAVAFFLHAARYAEISVSPHFKIPPALPPATGRPVRKARRSGKDEREGEPPKLDPATDLRTRYIEMLLDKAQEQDTTDSALLDRIETLLGFRSESKENGSGQPLSAAVPNHETT